MATHDLKYLWRATSTDGKEWRQGPQDLSITCGDVSLSAVSPGGREDYIPLKSPVCPEVMSQINAGLSVVEYRGRKYHWSAKSAYHDIRGYVERGELRTYSLFTRDGQFAAGILLSPQEDSYLGVEPGDIIFGLGGVDVIIPFSLPKQLWVVGDEGRLIRPKLKLKTDLRECLAVGETPDRMKIEQVYYRVGWVAEINGVSYEHFIRVG